MSPVRSAKHWLRANCPVWARWLALLSVLWLHWFGVLGAIGFGLFFLFVIMISHVFAMLLRRRRPSEAEFVAVMWLMCTPFFYYYANGVYKYSQGAASILVPSRSFYMTHESNIDRELRCQVSPFRCGTDFDFIFRHSNNAAIRMMTALFGSMPGAYVGPYPGDAEAAEAVATEGEPINVSNLISDRVVLGERTYPLVEGEGRRLLRRWDLNFIRTEEGRKFLDVRPAFQATVWKEECLILGLPQLEDGGEHQDGEVMVYAAIDIDTGKAFAIYCDTDTYQNLIPRVAWRRDLWPQD